MNDQRSKPLSALSEATPAWLTAVLHDNGYLKDGAVLSVRTSADRSTNASNGRLYVTYTANARGECPVSLFLKLCDETNQFGDSEVVYYTKIIASMTDAPAPHCYHAAYDPMTQCYHLLLSDLSDTHTDNWGIDPSLSHTGKTVDAIAQLHATWWDNPQLGTVGTAPFNEVIHRYIAYPAQGLPALLDEVSAMSIIDKDEWLYMIHTVFVHHPQMLKQRAGTQQHLTAVHADLNPGNILSPLNSHQGNGRAYLIDYQLFDWTPPIWVGAYDLSYMMVHWWPTEIRRQLERPLLERYHQQLLARGVQNYSFADLWQDYRLCAMQSLYVVAAWCVNDKDREAFGWVWRPQLEKTMQALIDLDCLALLSLP